MLDRIRSPLAPRLLAELRRLTHAAYGDAFTDDDLAHALGGEHVVVRDIDGRWRAHAAVVPRVLHIGALELTAGYVEAVAVLPEAQASGLGSRVMAEAGRIVGERYDIGALSTGDPEFYERLGWECWRGPSWVIDSGGVRRRTEDEDGGIMILRCAASRDVDTSLAIACHDRPGDAW